MSINAIQNTLQTLQSVAAQASGTKASAGIAENATESGFGGMLRDSIRKVNESQATATAKAKAFQLGDPNLSLNEVMVEGQKAGIEFQMGVKVRDRLVSAYKEVMSMPV
jgi:flagellar hook-basal body complex protein FliE